jgi:hypothetical protein
LPPTTREDGREKGVIDPEKAVGPLGVYSFPWPQPAIVVLPPARRVFPEMPWTAIPTFDKTIFSRMRLPPVAGEEEEV